MTTEQQLKTKDLYNQMTTHLDQLLKEKWDLAMAVGEAAGIRKTLEMIVFNLLKEEISLTVIEKVTGYPLERILFLQQKWQDG